MKDLMQLENNKDVILIEKLRKKTTVFEKDFDPVPLDWQVGDTERIYKYQDLYSLDLAPLIEAHNYKDISGEVEVAGYYRSFCASGLDAEKLPVEFFNHQVMEIDLTSESAIYNFVDRWGFPFIPSILVHHQLPGFYDFTNAIAESKTTVRAGISLLNQPEGDFETIVSKEEFNSMESDKNLGDVIGSHSGFEYEFISKAEIITVLQTLQTEIQSIRDWIESGERIRYFFISAASRAPYTLFAGDSAQGLPEYERDLAGGLTAAICNQVIDTARNPIPWRKCACEGCDVIFKHKQSDGVTLHEDAVYCSKRCENRQKQRNKRAKKKSK